MFAGWSGDLSGTSNPAVLTMNNNKVVTATFTSTATSAWTAYNDCIYDSTQHHAATNPNGQLVHYIAENVTTYGIGSTYSGPTSGELVDQATGNPTGVTVTLTESGGVTWQPDVSSNWYGGYDPALGTDARNTFGDIADMTGVIYYGSAGWYVDLTISGLDPIKHYTFATSAARCNADADYQNRFTIYTLSGADTYMQASTPGVIVHAPNQVEYCTGDNYNEGYVVRWTDITATDGTFTVRAEANATICPENRKAYAFDVFMLQEQQPLSFTLIALPDTQNYAQYYPTIYTQQTQWIVAQKNALNIVFVGHEGDIVNNAGSTTEYDNADTSMSYLEDPVTTGLPDGIPYSMVPGNHDQPTTNYNIYFGVSRFSGRGYYGGHYSTTNNNNYILFSAAGMDFIVVSLDYDPDTSELAWADSILQTYSSRRAILISHSILNTDASWTGPGLNIYNALSDNPNLFLMLCGHMHGEARRTDTDSGHTIYSLLADYQDYPNGGNGYLRIIEFIPAADEIQVRTYSPSLDQYETDTSSEFTLYYDMTVSTNTPPIVTDIPDQTITEGDTFTTINLDDYVTDAEDPDTSITWTYTGNTDLTIDITDRVVTITYSEGWIGAETITFTATDTGALSDSDDATFTVNTAPTVGWTAYNDLVGTSIPSNVTEYGYDTINGVLKDYTSGTDLTATMTGSYDIMDIHTTNGGNFNVGTDGYEAFDGIVDVTGTFELDTTSLQCTFTFNNLDPNKEYIITTTANRDNIDYLDARYAKVTIQGADTYTPASSIGVVINSDASVSFSIGYNTVNGYVAKWTGVTTGSDGSFSILSQWDDTLGSGTNNNKGYAMSAFKLEEVTPVPESFAIIVLPDTQFYSESYPIVYTNQTQWIVDQKDTLNIVYVGHEGDIVQNAGSTTEWDRANTSMSYLEDPVTTGLPDGIPYSMVPGNHDQPTTNYNLYFGVSRFTGRGYYGGYYSTTNDNNYVLFSAGGMDFIAVSLDYNPDSSEIAWADSILQTYSSRRAIVISHYILDLGGTFSSIGQTIFDALKDNPNLFLMLCGHIHGEARRTETYNGNIINILLADYQSLTPYGGNGYLRIMEFFPATNEIQVKTYSPYLDLYDTDVDSEFTLSYDMQEPEDVEPPTVTLNTPADDSTITSSTVEFSCSCTDNIDLQNVTLYTGQETLTPGSISVRVAASTDDAEEMIATGVPQYTSSDLELGYDVDYGGGTQLVGTRFSNVQIPQGATITNAYVEFECDVGTWTGEVPLQIWGQDADTAATFTTTTYDLSSRTSTTAIVPWTITEQWVVDSKYPSPDISAIIQEIVDRPGWSSGNAMAIMFTGSGSNRREAESYNGETGAAPLLVIEYTTGGDITWTAQETQALSGTSNTTTFTITLADGDYKWNCLAYDAAGNSAYAPSDFDLTINTSSPPTYYTLTTSIVGSGTVTPPSGSIYLAGTVVPVEATPDPGWQFDSWSGALTGDENPTTITMDDDKTITATFIEEPPETIALVQQNTYAHPYNSPDYGISVTLGSPATTNNLLVTGVAVDKASGTITVPAGFTLVQKGEGGISSGAMAYKIATGGETTISWSWTANEEGSVWIGEYTGLMITDVLDVSAENEAYLSTQTNTISTGTTPSTTQADELAIALFASDSGNSVGDTRSWTNGFTTLAEETDTSGSPFINIASKILDTTGTVESTLTHNGNDESYAMIATFKALTS